jgi:PAS domain S-box-containing protein
MKAEKNNIPKEISELRRRAEEKNAQSQKNAEPLSPEEAQHVLNELRVHQIELEMQNEELRTSHAEQEAARTRYFDLYDLAPVGYFTISEHGLILEANLTAAIMLDVHLGSLVGSPFSQFILNEDQNIYYLHRKELFKSGEMQAFDLRMLKQNGSTFWAQLDATATETPSTSYVDVATSTSSGRVSAGQASDDASVIRVVISDITERKAIEAGLEKTRQDLAATRKTADEAREIAESIINTIREPLIILNQDLRVITASHSFYEFFNVTPHETVGQLIYELGNKQWDIPGLRELLETILPQKTAFDNYEVEHDFADIGRRIMLLNARQIQRVLGNERILLLAIEDITERKRLEAEKARLETQNRQLNKAESLGRMSGAIAHHTDTKDTDQSCNQNMGGHR